MWYSNYICFPFQEKSERVCTKQRTKLWIKILNEVINMLWLDISRLSKQNQNMGPEGIRIKRQKQLTEKMARIRILV